MKKYWTIQECLAHGQREEQKAEADFKERPCKATESALIAARRARVQLERAQPKEGRRS